MKRYLRELHIVVLGLLVASTLGGCLVHTHGHDRRAASSPGCHPSQYWDGHECRHKGQGRGARKHDGR
jgi:hypothetical protein